MRSELPRGMRDIESDEYMLIDHARSKFIECCRVFGFSLMEPSPLELLSILEAKSGPMIRDEIYAFKDKAGRDVALRFDLTVGLTRYITARRDVRLPVKLAAFSSVWRYDEPQQGRYRWFHQWDVEIYDNFSVDSDAEVIDFVRYYFRSLGVDVRIEVSDRALMEEFIKERLGVNDEEHILDMLRAVDKLSKRSRDDILKEYSSKGMDVEKLGILLDTAGVRGSLDTIDERFKGLDTSRLAVLVDSLKSRGIDVNVNMGIVRGLDYYSSIVFEVYSSTSNLALVGGGRYDKLPKVFGRSDMGATGAAAGIERIIMLLKDKHEESKGVFVAYASKALKSDALMTVSMLRDRGIASEYIDGSLRKQLEYASSKGYAYTLIFAEREYREGYVIIKDMRDGSERKVDAYDIAGNIGVTG